MILEMKRTLYKPRSTPAVNAAFADALADRTTISPLLGFFHVDVGVLNSTIELWPYESLEERDNAYEKATQLSNWPPALDELRVEEETALLSPASFNDPLEPGAYGGVYEIRVYTINADGLERMLERWGAQIDARRELSRLTGLFYSNEGDERIWVHIWPYADAAERARIRAAAVEAGTWPPSGTEGILIAQESMLVTPAPFSPLH